MTTIYRPNGAGPFPLIMFSHGLSGHPDKFTKLFSVWADAGFAIAAPAFPLTNDHVANSNSNVADVAQQPGDVSFVLDKVLALDRQPGSRLFHAIDEHRIGAGGLSHHVGTPTVGDIDEEFDRWFLDRLEQGRIEELLDLTDAEIELAGNGAHEIRSWLTVAGAAAPGTARTLAYEPVYPWITGMAVSRFVTAGVS